MEGQVMDDAFPVRACFATDCGRLEDHGLERDMRGESPDQSLQSNAAALRECLVAAFAVNLEDEAPRWSGRKGRARTVNASTVATKCGGSLQVRRYSSQSRPSSHEMLASSGHRHAARHARRRRRFPRWPFV